MNNMYFKVNPDNDPDFRSKVKSFLKENNRAALTYAEVEKLGGFIAQWKRYVDDPIYIQTHTPEQVRLQTVYLDFLELKSDPTREQINEVENALSRIRLIMTSTFQLDNLIESTLTSIRAHDRIYITNDVEIQAITDMIDYLEILKVVRRKAKNTRKEATNEKL